MFPGDLEVVIFLSRMAGTEFFLFTALGCCMGKRYCPEDFDCDFSGCFLSFSSLNLKFCHFNILWFCPPLQFQDDLYSQHNANRTWTFYIIFSMKITKCSLNKVIPPLLGREIVFQFCRWGNRVHNLLGTPYGAYRKSRRPGFFYSCQPGRCLRSLFYEYHVAL